MLGFKGAGDWTRGCSLSGLYPSTNLAWVDLQGTGVPAGTALRVTDTRKPYQNDKVPAQGRVSFHTEIELPRSNL